MDPPSAGSVSCPTCGVGVSVSLPRSASDHTVVAAPDEELEDAIAEDPRTRCLRYDCPADHEVYVYFEW